MFENKRREEILKENARLMEKLVLEKARSKQLSADIKTLINETMPLNVNPKIKAAGQQFLDAKTEIEENEAVTNILHTCRSFKKSS
jgi:CMP-N-acetylneuraminic acid synthetase